VMSLCKNCWRLEKKKPPTFYDNSSNTLIVQGEQDG
jgi:hypothetical protein